LEFDRGERFLTTTANKKWVLAVLREFVIAVAREEFNGQQFSVQDIYSAADQKKFFNKVAARHPKPNRSAKRWTVSAETTLTDADRARIAQRKRKGPHRRTTDRTRLIPSKSRVRPPVGRANDIYHELRRLEVENYRNAVSILLRVFLEFSVEAYVARRGVTGVTPADKLSKKLQLVAQHMEHNAVMGRRELLAVRKAATDPNSLFSTTTLNAYVHNSNFYPSAHDLKASWDNLEPFIEKLWHG
jgi:hypothetical protein